MKGVDCQFCEKPILPTDEVHWNGRNPWHRRCWEGKTPAPIFTDEHADLVKQILPTVPPGMGPYFMGAASTLCMLDEVKPTTWLFESAARCKSMVEFQRLYTAWRDRERRGGDLPE